MLVHNAPQGEGPKKCPDFVAFQRTNVPSSELSSIVSLYSSQLEILVLQVQPARIVTELW
jgi:hypothetical protein